MVYLHSMGREFCFALGALALSGLSAQNDTIFPNVMAEFHQEWPCWDQVGSNYTMYWDYIFQAEPTVSMDGLEWGTLVTFNGLIRVDEDLILYHGFGGTFGLTDSTVVLYDFSIGVGDTAYWDDYYTYDYAVVVLIETVQVVGRERRLFTLSNGDRWLEGIGSLMGLFRPLYVVPYGCGDPYFYYCAEYVDDEGTAYSICSEDLPLGSDSRKMAVPQVYPNPSDGRFTLSTSGAVGAYRVMDATGKELRQGSLYGRETVVDLMSAAPGLYMVEVNGLRTKLIVE